MFVRNWFRSKITKLRCYNSYNIIDFIWIESYDNQSIYWNSRTIRFNRKKWNSSIFFFWSVSGSRISFFYISFFLQRDNLFFWSNRDSTLKQTNFEMISFYQKTIKRSLQSSRSQIMKKNSQIWLKCTSMRLNTAKKTTISHTN